MRFTESNKVKIAVTGASGFIGRHVLVELVRRSIEVVAATRNPGKLAEAGKTVRVVALDIAQPGPDVYGQLGRPDALIHLAWDGLPNYNSLHHFETELPRQYKFLKDLVDAGLPALLATGTCFEYGMQSGPLSEETATRPENSYGYAKDALRRQLQFLHRTHPFRFTWARLFYMYGDGQPSSSLYPQVKSAVERGAPSFNMSGGEQLRDYLPIGEVARLIVELAVRGADVGPVNLCSGRPVSVRSLVEGWLAESAWSIALKFGHYPYPDYEPMAFWGDRRRLDTLLEQP